MKVKKGTELMCCDLQIKQVTAFGYEVVNLKWAAPNSELIVNGSPEIILQIFGNEIKTGSTDGTDLRLAKIPESHQFENITIQEVLMRLSENGYLPFIWVYPVSAAKPAQITERLAVMVAFPYEGSNGNGYQHLRAAKAYMYEWIEGLNRSLLCDVNNTSEVREYPFLQSFYSEGQLVSKLPCVYAGITSIIDII